MWNKADVCAVLPCRPTLSSKRLSAKQITTAGDATGIFLIVSIASLLLLCKSQHTFNLSTLLFRFPFSFQLKQSSYFPQNELSLLSQNTYTHTRTHAHAHTHARTRTHTHTHTHTHTRTHARTHMTQITSYGVLIPHLSFFCEKYIGKYHGYRCSCILIILAHSLLYM